MKLSRNWLVVVIPLGIVAAGVSLGGGAGARAAGTEAVRVTNFPEVQKVTGSVRVEEPAPGSRLLRVVEMVSPGIEPGSRAMAAGGWLDVDGFRRGSLSLSGTTKGVVRQAGEVGIFLIPDVPEVERALREEGEIQLALEARVLVPAGGSGSFSAGPVEASFAFPRYRVYWFDTTDRTVEVALYAYVGG